MCKCVFFVVTTRIGFREDLCARICSRCHPVNDSFRPDGCGVVDVGLYDICSHGCGVHARVDVQLVARKNLNRVFVAPAVAGLPVCVARTISIC